MKLHLLFIGNKFVYNKTLREYALRKIEEKSDFIDSIIYFKDSDNSLFLYLESELNSSNKLMIVTSKQHFSTIGKLICTATGDNQILKDNMLLPSKVDVFEEASYLLSYKNSITNVIYIDELQTMPDILLPVDNSKATLHIFNEEKDTVITSLSSIAQTYEVSIDVVTLINQWQRVDVRSKKYGNISRFISAAKKLMPRKLIAASNIIDYIIDVLSRENKTVSFAESCTGGLLTYYFVERNGASKILNGSLITYSNGLKENWLGVKKNTLEQYGAVSAEVAYEMSDGAMGVSEADYSISISGIAGDMGGSVEKPAGTIYLSVRTKDTSKEVRLQLDGDRNYVQETSVLFAIKILILMDKDVFFKI
jgi:nicotinamide-nucleotide amidase